MKKIKKLRQTWKIKNLEFKYLFFYSFSLMFMLIISKIESEGTSLIWIAYNILNVVSMLVNMLAILEFSRNDPKLLSK